MLGQRIGIWMLLLGLGLIPAPSVVAQPTQPPITAPSTDTAETDRLNQQVIELYRQGQYTDAIPLAQEVLRRYRQGEGDLKVATALNNLAGLYESQGRYSEAEPLYKQSLEIIRTSLPADDPDLATSINNLAGLYHAQGRYSEAEPLFIQAIEIDRKSLPADHSQLATHLNNLASLYRVQGRYSEAEPLFMQALEIKRKSLPADHPSLATSINNLAGLYESQGRYSEAEPLYKQAIEIDRKSLPADHPQLAAHLNNLAGLYESQGRYSEAEPLYKQTLEMVRKSLPADHSYLSITLNNLAGLYWASNNVPQTLTTLQQGLDIEENNLAKNLDFGAEAQKRNYLTLFSGTTDVAISVEQQLAPRNPQAQQLALNTILRRKGRLLDVQGQTLSRLRHNADLIIRTQLDQLAYLKSTLSNLTNQGVPTSNPEEYQQQRQALEQQITQLEAQLSHASAELRHQFNPATLIQVQTQIPTDAVLIEFMRYRPVNPTGPEQERYRPARYTVYLLNTTGQIQSADLGPAKDLEPLIQQFRADMADTSLTRVEVRASAQTLYTKLLEPIQQHLSQYQHLLIAPDGPLNLVPFEALMDSQQRFLVQTHQITYLSSGRDLLRLQDPSRKTQEALLIASPDYNYRITRPKADEPTIGGMPPMYVAQLQGSQKRSADFRNTTFQPLPGTLEEGQALDNLLSNSHLLIKEEATETAFKASATPHILHIATHGFFLEDQPLPRTDGSSSFPIRQQYENPLLRAGLAFAGSNHRPQDPDDGILTALEVSGLDLRGTELVALSACQTGLGDISYGEGVYGLRRAFTLAGARSQLMSLWNVRDVSTKDLMVAYYTRLKKGQGRGEALRAVQLEMLNGTMRDKEGKTYKHPYFWAAFVRTGDWRPMQLP